MYVCMYVCMYIYIYMRERERQIEIYTGKCPSFPATKQRNDGSWGLKAMPKMPSSP